MNHLLAGSEAPTNHWWVAAGELLVTN